MGILILGAFLILAVGMGVGTLAAAQLGIHEVIGQLAGVALVATVAILVLRAQDKKRRQPPPPAPPVVTATAEAPATPEFALDAPADAVAEAPVADDRGEVEASTGEPVDAAAVGGPPTAGLVSAVD